MWKKLKVISQYLLIILMALVISFPIIATMVYLKNNNTTTK